MAVRCLQVGTGRKQDAFASDMKVLKDTRCAGSILHQAFRPSSLPQAVPAVLVNELTVCRVFCSNFGSMWAAIATGSKDKTEKEAFHHYPFSSTCLAVRCSDCACPCPTMCLFPPDPLRLPTIYTQQYTLHIFTPATLFSLQLGRACMSNHTLPVRLLLVRTSL